MNGIGIEKYVFISYKSEEKARADEIQKFLEQNGIRCWKAPESLHNRGTQDYNSDIIDAIRKCGCLLFLMSNKALCSDWVRKEVKYALEKCHKPVIPYVVDPIPAEKYDSDELVISLSLLKQILNENQANDLSVLLPYVRTSLGIANGAEETSRPESASGEFGTLRGMDGRMSESAFDLLLEEAEFQLARVDELSKIDYLDPTPRPFGAYQMELRESVRIAATNFITILSAVVDGTVSCDIKRAKEAAASLYRLTYDQGKEFNAEIFGLVEPYARRGDPWANFVMAVKYYFPLGGVVQKSQDNAFKCFSIAVKDPDNPYAMIMFGICRQWGIGCDVSGTRAEFWYERAVSEGCVTAYAYLGRLYQFAPIGITRDLARAEECFKKGVDAGDATAMYRYAEFLLREARYDEAVEMYAKAYEHGYLVALADLAIMVGAGYSPEDEKYKDKNLLRRRALSANLPLWKYLLAQEAMRNDPPFEDAAFAFAISGAGDRNASCADVLGDLVMGELADKHREAAEESAKVSLESRFGDLWEFLEKEVAGNDASAAVLIRAILELAREKGGVKIVAGLDGYANFSLPRSCFWRALVDSGLSGVGDEDSCLPSSFRYLNGMTPYRFLEAVRTCRAKPGSSLEKVQKIWDVLRWLGYERVDVMQILNRRSSLLTSDAAENARQRIQGVVARLKELLVLAPELPFWMGHRLDELARSGDGECGLISDIALNKRLKDEFDGFWTSLQDDHRLSVEMKMAVLLWRDEMFNSDPGLDLAVSCYHSAYLWGDSPEVAAKLATLFLINNGRLRSTMRNESIVYAVSSMLKNAIYQKELTAVPAFLELMLFGFRTGASVVEPDFDAIRTADAVIDEMTLLQDGDDAMDMRELRFEVAYAMAKVYLDEELYKGSRCEQQWGVSTLLDYAKASQWLCRARDLAPEGKEELVRQIESMIRTLGERGYDFGIGNTLHGLQSKPEEEDSTESVVDPDDECQKLIERVSGIVKNLKTKADAIPRVVLKGDHLDVAVSTDRTAILLMLLPEDADFAVRRIEGEVCHGSIQPVDGEISVGFVEMLDRLRTTLGEMEPDSAVEIGVVAGKRMLGRIAGCLGPEVESRGLNLFSYDDLGSQLDAVFAKYGDDGSDDETGEDGEKNPS